MAKYRTSPTPEDKKRFRGRYTYFRRLGFSKYEATAYSYIKPGDSHLQKLIGDQKTRLRGIGYNLKESARLSRDDRDHFMDRLEAGETIPDDYNPYYRLGYGLELGPQGYSLLKKGYA